MTLREIQAGQITAEVRRLCIEGNTILEDDVVAALERGLEKEESPAGKDCFRQLLENAKVA